jgi:hypothetical protein
MQAACLSTSPKRPGWRMTGGTAVSGEEPYETVARLLK